MESLLRSFTAAQSTRQPYRHPMAAELETAGTGFAAWLDGRPHHLADLGFSVSGDVVVQEPGTERAWGLYAIDRSAPPSLVVEVPHPSSDLRTDRVGLALFRRVPGAVLAVAGAHRRREDPAHDTRTVFHVVSTLLARRGLPQVQLHGFNDRTMPAADVVVSAGAAEAGDAARRAADRLEAAGFRVRRAWADPCRGLTGTTNVQSQAAGGTPFLHVELNRTTRETRRDDVVRALAEADLRKP
ncbi:MULTISPECIES: hypothetical protein [unclassified Amycolatopsis]|uniref:hypothetical protein n=1 Tax=unclassified Amycolatopsis TaxID=2618356 RepID=UPI002874150E|nr:MULTISPECIES: hypothetical protein [unclassified Amycolatopsis]MDS0135370.1 hypothetical protein [Amycolatopsis sp. 505]MDS0140939.1 hypothetical protein [Amycolatopsis sp. CM201R]